MRGRAARKGALARSLFEKTESLGTFSERFAFETKQRTRRVITRRGFDLSAAFVWLARPRNSPGSDLGGGSARLRNLVQCSKHTYAQTIFFFPDGPQRGNTD